MTASNPKCGQSSDEPNPPLRQVVVQHIPFMLHPIVADEIERLQREVADCCPEGVEAEWCDYRQIKAERDRLRALLGQYPERAVLCHAGHEPLIHFGECPLCSADETSV